GPPGAGAAEKTPAVALARATGAVRDGAHRHPAQFLPATGAPAFLRAGIRPAIGRDARGRSQAAGGRNARSSAARALRREDADGRGGAAAYPDPWRRPGPTHSLAGAAITSLHANTPRP